MDNFNLFYDQGLSSPALDFLQSSAMESYTAQECGERIMNIMQSPYYAAQIIGHTDERGFVEKIALPKSFNAETENLRNIHFKRKSHREFHEHIHLEELSSCLLSAYFVTERYEQHSHHLARRSIASGGALYPIDLYYISLHTTGLEQGIYAFHPHHECLECLKKYPQEKLLDRSLHKIFPKDILGSWSFSGISGILVLGAVLHRCSCKYGDRGLRFALMDTGALCQNLYLSAAACQLACCAIGGYIDYELDRFMGFQAPNETALLCMFIGK